MNIDDLNRAIVAANTAQSDVARIASKLVARDAALPTTTAEVEALVLELAQIATDTEVYFARFKDVDYETSPERQAVWTGLYHRKENAIARLTDYGHALAATRPAEPRPVDGDEHEAA